VFYALVCGLHEDGGRPPKHEDENKRLCHCVRYVHVRVWWL